MAKFMTPENISAQKLTHGINHPECGAICTFDGVVRNHHEGKVVLKLAYSCYEKMAELELGRILTEANTQWPECHIAVQHRLGELQIGDVAVAIAVWAPHRHEAFAGCSYMIEAIKARLPVWKKEFYNDNSIDWVLCSHHHAESRKAV